jgi:peptide/nickel transport system permease protein
MESAESGVAASKPAAPPGFWATVVRDTTRQWGARAGMAWIGLLSLLACYAPFIANSAPYFMRDAAGKATSPMWRAMTPMDLLLALAATALIVGGVVGLRGGKLLAVVVAAALVGGGVGLLKGTPATFSYDTFREMEREGQATHVIRAPIPYSPSDRNRDNPDARNRHPFWAENASEVGPGRFVLGTERDGADVASRLIHACRVALAIGLVATGISSVIGVVVGGILGYFAGTVDMLGMRAIEIFEAPPRLMLLLALASIFGADILFLMVIIGLTSWTGNARYIRAEFLRLRKQDFVQAAEASGLPTSSIIFRHVLPNGITPLLVSISFGVASAILAEATLAFLGLSKPDQPSWGQLLNQARAGGEFLWWIAIFPGLMIFLTVLSYTLIGEAVRDALDPTLKRRE